MPKQIFIEKAARGWVIKTYDVVQTGLYVASDLPELLAQIEAVCMSPEDRSSLKADPSS